MFVIHFKLHRRLLVLCAALAALAVALVFLLSGCKKEGEIPSAPDQASRIAYLEGWGWQVTAQEKETLDLQLPEKLEDSWGEYAAMQAEQGLSFAEFAGRQVRRYTYPVTNYPGRDDVQINLFLCGDEIIGGDVIAVGKDGFRTGLTFPET